MPCSPKSSSPRWCLLLLAATLVALAFLYFRCIDQQVVGFIHDDGEYAISSRAMASGHGFRLLNLPQQPAQIRYPVGYPLILSMGWRLFPDFPDNIVFLKGLTATFALLSLLLIYFYLLEQKRVPPFVAWLVVLLVGTSYQFVVYSTALMSEAPFLLFSVLTVWLAERFVSAPRWRSLLLVAVLSALCFHIRSVGVALGGAILLALLFHRHWRWSLAYGVAFALAAAPWVAWVSAHDPGVLEGAEIVRMRPYISYLNMSDMIAENGVAGIVSTLLAGFENLNSLFLDNLLPLVPNALTLLPDGTVTEQSTFVWAFVIMLYLLRWVLVGYFVLQLVNTARRREVSVGALYTLSALLLIMLWNVRESMPRFLITLLPFLWYYSLRPLLPALRERGIRAKGPVLVLGSLVLMSAWPVYVGLRSIETHRSGHVFASFSGAAELWNDYKATFEYVRASIPEEAAIAAREDVVFHLYTDRTAVYLHHASLREDAEPRQAYLELYQGLEENGVRYLALEPTLHTPDRELAPNPVAMTLIEGFGDRLEWRYSSPNGLIVLFELVR